MKKAIGMAIIMLFVGSTAAMAQGIGGSAHDFSGQGWSGGEICQVCHTPHNSDDTVVEAPLWDHELSAAAYTPYSGTDMQATVGQPDAESKLCLACHDGTVALENFGGATGGITFVSTGLVGTDLTDDHPVSFTYDNALFVADPGLRDPATYITILGGTIAEDFLYGGKVQCSSCHAVHNETGLANLLITSNGGSVLCLSCHNK